MDLEQNLQISLEEFQNGLNMLEIELEEIEMYAVEHIFNEHQDEDNLTELAVLLKAFGLKPQTFGAEDESKT
jgi:hypothetical protein